ncbi:transposase [Streptomyces sp. NPDC058812]|uniref:transposase n=2 Tax=unclassified Streptomyces TaxID=2593676 RepID=UPI00369512C4
MPGCPLQRISLTIGVTQDGGREVVGVMVGDSETEVFWAQFLRHLRERGLSCVRLGISDSHSALVKAIRKRRAARPATTAIWRVARAATEPVSPCVPRSMAVVPMTCDPAPASNRAGTYSRIVWAQMSRDEASIAGTRGRMRMPGRERSRGRPPRRQRRPARWLSGGPR